MSLFVGPGRTESADSSVQTELSCGGDGESISGHSR